MSTRLSSGFGAASVCTDAYSSSYRVVRGKRAILSQVRSHLQTETKMTFKIPFRTTEERNEIKKVDGEVNHIL